MDVVKPGKKGQLSLPAAALRKLGLQGAGNATRRGNRRRRRGRVTIAVKIPEAAQARSDPRRHLRLP